MLDTAAERDFDEITRLAAEICDTPIALVIDGERQWFKSRENLELREIPREVSFCTHAIATEEAPFVVPDASEDPRFATNVLVTGEPFVRFYAGVPVATEAGLNVGILCVLDRRPRRPAEEQGRALGALGRQVSALLELRRSRAALAEELEV